MAPDSKDNHKTYIIIPGPRMGVVLPELLQTVAVVIKKHDIPQLKLTVAQRLALIWLCPGKDRSNLARPGQQRLAAKKGRCPLHQGLPRQSLVQVWGTRRPGPGRQAGKDLAGNSVLSFNAKVKVGISGCQLNCCESYVRDLGIFGKKNGWTLVFGGNGARKPRIGDVIDENMSDEQVLELAVKVLAYYNANAENRERTARFMERTDLRNCELRWRMAISTSCKAASRCKDTTQVMFSALSGPEQARILFLPCPEPTYSELSTATGKKLWEKLLRAHLPLMQLPSREYCLFFSQSDNESYTIISRLPASRTWRAAAPNSSRIAGTTLFSGTTLSTPPRETATFGIP